MKNQALFSSKGKSKKLKCCLLQFLFGPLRANRINTVYICKLGKRSVGYKKKRQSYHNKICNLGSDHPKGN